MVRAHSRLWLVMVFVLLGIGIGGAWDRSYHATHAFDTFYSPPHLFIYTMFLIVALTVVSIVFSPKLRPWFGRSLTFSFLPFEIPGALFILGGGVVAVALAGGLDDLWHSTFGLDETGWSAPHAMLGWGLLVIVFGFVASRLAFAPQRPLGRSTPYIIGYLILGFSVTPFLGPLYGNNNPETVRAIAAIPVLAIQPAAQHTFRIYLQWNIDRTNPIFAPLAAVWAGTVLALVRNLDPRPRVLLTVSLVFSLLSLLSDRGTARYLDQFFNVSGDPASWLPLPILPAALALLGLSRIGLRQRTTWALVGGIFGILVFLIWGSQPYALGVALLAAPAMVLGAAVGERVSSILLNPAKQPIEWFVPLAGVGMPLLLGLVDLVLRIATP